MKTCEKCSNPVPDEKAFCPNCGAAMTPERARTPDYISEEMGPTMYGYDAPLKKPPTQKLPPLPVKATADKAAPEKPGEAATAKPATAAAAEKPVKAEASRAPSAAKVSPEPPLPAREPAKAATKRAPADEGNRTLHLILGASAVIFALSILLVVILYVTGKL